jgi:hypothetical protein
VIPACSPVPRAASLVVDSSPLKIPPRAFHNALSRPSALLDITKAVVARVEPQCVTHDECHQRAGEDKERQRYRTRLDAEADGATRTDIAAGRRCEAAVARS